ncbi:MAG: PIN domain-containing protein [Bacteroidales bacterium]|nr:PIN domain-containing protein [Bacteroidales bacterium]
MSDKVFIDTNIWVYARVEGTDLEKHKKAISFLRNLSNRVIISTQVINKFYSALSKNMIAEAKIQSAIEQILPDVELNKLSLNTIRKSWEIKLKYQLSIYDSLIIASALEADCKILYTEDLQHNQLIEGKLRIINPFISE